MSSKITPTVGRVVYYAPHANVGSAGFHEPAAGAPLAAIVAAVHDDGTLNLSVFDAQGFPHSRLDVPLVDEWGEGPKGGNYAYWMPYQLAQAGIKPMPGGQVAASMALPSIPADRAAETMDHAQLAKLGEAVASPSKTIERSSARSRSEAIEHALRTAGLHGHDEVLDAAKAYEKYITAGA
jgi:hypothetical protein